MFCFRRKKTKDRTFSKMEDGRTREDKDRTDTSKPASLSKISDAGKTNNILDEGMKDEVKVMSEASQPENWNKMSSGAIGNVTGMNRHDRTVDALKDLLFRLHISVQRKFSEESKKNFLRWQVCPNEIVQAMEEIYNAHSENRYKDCLGKAKATLEMIEGFEENKLPFKQELLAYTYSCMALTYVETGDFNKVKKLSPKDRRKATLKSMEMLPAAADQWDFSLLYLEIAKCNLQVENRLYFPQYSRASLNAAANAVDQEMQLYANILFALIEEIQYSHFTAEYFINRSLEMAKGLKDSVASVDIQNVLREVAGLSFESETVNAYYGYGCYLKAEGIERPVASPFSSDDDEPPVPHIYSDSDDETEPKQVHMGTAPSEETHLKMVDTVSTNTDEDTIPKVFHRAIGQSLPERLGPEGSSEPPSFHPAVSSSEEEPDSSSSGEETYQKLI